MVMIAVALILTGVCFAGDALTVEKVKGSGMNEGMSIERAVDSASNTASIIDRLNAIEGTITSQGPNTGDIYLPPKFPKEVTGNVVGLAPKDLISTKPPILAPIIPPVLNPGKTIVEGSNETAHTRPGSFRQPGIVSYKPAAEVRRTYPLLRADYHRPYYDSGATLGMIVTISEE